MSYKLIVIDASKKGDDYGRKIKPRLSVCGDKSNHKANHSVKVKKKLAKNGFRMCVRLNLVNLT